MVSENTHPPTGFVFPVGSNHAVVQCSRVVDAVVVVVVVVVVVSGHITTPSTTSKSVSNLTSATRGRRRL
jgi:hypothetical protein